MARAQAGRKGKRAPQPLLRRLPDGGGDLPHILQYAGEDRIVIGSDYGHADTSSQLEALRVLQGNEAVSPEARRKIVDDNAQALYGI